MHFDIRTLLAEALHQAEEAFKKGNYPIGSVLTDEEGTILGMHQNEANTNHDITAHAEILCIRDVEHKIIDNKSGKKTILFTSLEPCGGCSFFIERTSIAHVVWALTDPFKGGMKKLTKSRDFGPVFSNIKTTAEPFTDLADQSRNLMYEFFIKSGKPHLANHYML